ncbi:gamma-aminobutyric acid receptor subunit beta-1-like [Haliotis cracherodii]|uniref:gamma-aminobutyric acid receptor subunit beta-1-like n=1 Tax=Haliotis cracherodii TaxID=6455 RepID=UPI0039E76455
MWKKRSPWLLFLLGVELFCCYDVSGLCSNITACSDVRDNLTRDYNQKLKPVGQTTIHMSLDMRVLKEVTWKDERLMWSDREPDYLIFGNDEIWTPNIYIPDVNEKGLAGIFGDGPIPLRMLPDGTVEWSPRLITTTTCIVNILYYPYDSQTCQLTITESSYRVTDVLLKSNTTITSNYVNNGQWEFSSSVKTSYNITDARGLEYSAIKYTFKFKRYSK